MEKIRKKISDYKKNLYSRKYKNNNKSDLKEIRKLHEEYKRDINSDWKGVSKNLEKNRNLYKYEKESGINIFTIMFFIAFSFFIISIAVAGFFLYFQKNNAPLNQLELSLTSANAIDSGEVFEYILDFENNTKHTFKNIEIFTKYPEGTTGVEYGLEKKTDNWEIDDIEGNTTKRIKRSIILSGTPKDQKEIELIIHYQIDGYSSTLTKKKKFKVEIASAPIFVKIKTPQNIMSKEEFDIDIEVSSNSNKDLKNLVLIGRYPNGFDIIKYDPNPIYQTDYKNIFKIEDLKVGEKKTIHMKAILVGENSEPKVLSFTVGNSNSIDNEIKTKFFEAKEKIIIKKPSLDLEFLCNNKRFDGDMVIKANDKIKCVFKIKNNLNTKVSDIELKMKYNDKVLKENKIKADDGYIDSNKNSITWNKNTNVKFKVLSGGEDVSGNFTLYIKNTTELAGFIKNPELLLNFDISGTNFDNETSIGSVKNSIVKTMKINTDVIIESETRFAYDIDNNIFQNQGSANPKVGQESTYTIIWKIYNSTNRLKNIVLSAKLPLGVEYKNIIFPNNYYVVYNPEIREIKWVVKKIEPYIGYRTDPKTLSFQIGYIPSLSEVGTYKRFTVDKKFQAEDEFTGTIIEQLLPSDTSSLSDKDLNNDGKVQK